MRSPPRWQGARHIAGFPTKRARFGDQYCGTQCLNAMRVCRATLTGCPPRGPPGRRWHDSLGSCRETARTPPEISPHRHWTHSLLPWSRQRRPQDRLVHPPAPWMYMTRKRKRKSELCRSVVYWTRRPNVHTRWSWANLRSGHRSPPARSLNAHAPMALTTSAWATARNKCSRRGHQHQIR